MNPDDLILFRQLKVVQKVIADETWLEGERRGCAVSSHDTVVRENVCRVILRIGREMRENAARAFNGENASVTSLTPMAARDEAA